MYLTCNANQEELLLQYIVTGNDKIRQHNFASTSDWLQHYDTLLTVPISCPVISMSLDHLMRIWLENNFYDVEIEASCFFLAIDICSYFFHVVM
jgi:hypothetical protein